MVKQGYRPTLRPPPNGRGGESTHFCQKVTQILKNRCDNRSQRKRKRSFFQSHNLIMRSRQECHKNAHTSAIELQFFTLFWGTVEKIAEIESTQRYIQVHAVIPEMVTKRLNHSIKIVHCCWRSPKKQIVVSITFDCLYMGSTFSKEMNCACKISCLYEHLCGIRLLPVRLCRVLKKEKQKYDCDNEPRSVISLYKVEYFAIMSYG